jgi:Family of unknown function (DUF6516)
VNPFRSLPEYELFIYTLTEQFASIQQSTLVIARRGSRFAILEGAVAWANGYRLTISEHLTLEDGPIVIEFYGYEVSYRDIKLYWYDSQAHPNDPTLASTHPHHKHVPPDIKHNRIPAPGLSFTQPNLPFLIQEIEQTFFGN